MSAALDEIDAKLAAIGARLEDRRAQVRAELAREPELLALADQLKATFGARLTWLKTDRFEFGRELPRGVIPARPFTVKRRGRPA